MSSLTPKKMKEIENQYKEMMAKRASKVYLTVFCDTKNLEDSLTIPRVIMAEIYKMNGVESVSYTEASNVISVMANWEEFEVRSKVEEIRRIPKVVSVTTSILRPLFQEMSIAVTFEITVKDNTSIHALAKKLDHMGLTVLPYSSEKLGKDDFDPKHLMCTSLFPAAQALESSLALKSSLGAIEDVENVNIVHYSKKKDKIPWYDRFIIPLLISAAVYMLGVLVALLHISTQYSIKLEPMSYLTYLFIPAIISILTGVGYIRHRQIFW